MPAGAALFFASFAAIGSLVLAPADTDYRPSWFLSWLALGVGVAAVAYFAFAVFSIIGERRGGKPKLPAWSELSDAGKDG